MNGRGGCCIARYDGGCGGMHGMSKVDRIMLKFRPIAPKPVAAGSGSGGSTAESGDGYVKCRRSKRRYVRVNGSNRKKDGCKGCSCVKRKVSASESEFLSPPPPPKVVTLSLLPETPDWKGNFPVKDYQSGKSDLLLPEKATKERMCENNSKRKSAPAPVWLSFNNQQKTVCYGQAGRDEAVVVVQPPVPPPPPPRRTQAVSYVTVECVTDSWVNGGGIRFTDEERVRSMERDTCPVFISDYQDRVLWTNKAYKQMAMGGLPSCGEEIAVVLVRKDKRKSALVSHPAFTCKVKVTTGPSPACSTMTLPCDAWRMVGGGYAWRLDVKAALCLGR